MIIPATIDITAYRNSVLQADITLKDNGSVIDFTGFSALMQIRTTPGAPSSLLSLATSGSTPAGSVLSFPNITSGVVRVFIQNADFADFPDNPAWSPAQYAYDLLMIAPSTYPDVYLYGKFLLNEGVTRQ